MKLQRLYGCIALGLFGAIAGCSSQHEEVSDTQAAVATMPSNDMFYVFSSDGATNLGPLGDYLKNQNLVACVIPAMDSCLVSEFDLLRFLSQGAVAIVEAGPYFLIRIGSLLLGQPSGAYPTRDAAVSALQVLQSQGAWMGEVGAWVNRQNAADEDCEHLPETNVTPIAGLRCSTPSLRCAAVLLHGNEWKPGYCTCREEKWQDCTVMSLPKLDNE